MSFILSIDSVQLSFLDRQAGAIRDFYRHILGLNEVAGESGARLTFALGNATLSLSPVAALAAGVKADYLALRTDAFEAVRDRLHAAGHHPVCSADNAPERVMYVKDPSGNQLALLG
ncbi:MAG: VOC family protein [Achromobacter mucicolens]|uniref:VOC family protein n=1 Tax=Achromobacter mucicolens TaxID=1389922 RepID=UPI003D1487EA